MCLSSLSDHKCLEAGVILYSFMPQSLLQGLEHNGLSKMFIRWIMLTTDISEVPHKIVLWADILGNLMI